MLKNTVQQNNNNTQQQNNTNILFNNEIINTNEIKLNQNSNFKFFNSSQNLNPPNQIEKKIENKANDFDIQLNKYLTDYNGLFCFLEEENKQTKKNIEQAIKLPKTKWTHANKIDAKNTTLIVGEKSPIKIIENNIPKILTDKSNNLGAVLGNNVSKTSLDKPYADQIMFISDIHAKYTDLKNLLPVMFEHLEKGGVVVNCGDSIVECYSEQKKTNNPDDFNPLKVGVALLLLRKLYPSQFISLQGNHDLDDCGEKNEHGGKLHAAIDDQFKKDFTQEIINLVKNKLVDTNEKNENIQCSNSENFEKCLKNILEKHDDVFSRFSMVNDKKIEELCKECLSNLSEQSYKTITTAVKACVNNCREFDKLYDDYIKNLPKSSIPTAQTWQEKFKFNNAPLLTQEQGKNFSKKFDQLIEIRKKFYQEIYNLPMIFISKSGVMAVHANVPRSSNDSIQNTSLNKILNTDYVILSNKNYNHCNLDHVAVSNESPLMLYSGSFGEEMVTKYQELGFDQIYVGHSHITKKNGTKVFHHPKELDSYELVIMKESEWQDLGNKVSNNKNKEDITDKIANKKFYLIVPDSSSIPLKPTKIIYKNHCGEIKQAVIDLNKEPFITLPTNNAYKINSNKNERSSVINKIKQHINMELSPKFIDGVNALSSNTGNKVIYEQQNKTCPQDLLPHILLQTNSGTYFVPSDDQNKLQSEVKKIHDKEQRISGRIESFQTTIKLKQNPLLFYCATGNLEEIKKLMKNSWNVKEDIEKIDKTYKMNALHVACRCNQKEVVQYLLEQGANTEIKDEDKQLGYSALHHAVDGGSLDIVKLIQKERVKKLKEKATVDIPSTVHGRHPLHIAAYFDLTEIAEFLITKCGANVNCVEKTDETCEATGATPLHTAANRSNFEFIKLLFSLASQNLMVQKKDHDGNGDTALYTTILSPQKEKGDLKRNLLLFKNKGYCLCEDEIEKLLQLEAKSCNKGKMNDILTTVEEVFGTNLIKQSSISTASLSISEKIIEEKTEEKQNNKNNSKENESSPQTSLNQNNQNEEKNQNKKIEKIERNEKIEKDEKKQLVEIFNQKNLNLNFQQSPQSQQSPQNENILNIINDKPLNKN